MTDNDGQFDIKEFKRTVTFDESPQRRAAFAAMNMLALGLSVIMSFAPAWFLLVSSGIGYYLSLAMAVAWAAGIRMLITVYIRRKYHWTRINVTYTRKES